MTRPELTRNPETKGDSGTVTREGGETNSRQRVREKNRNGRRRGLGYIHKDNKALPNPWAKERPISIED